MSERAKFRVFRLPLAYFQVGGILKPKERSEKIELID